MNRGRDASQKSYVAPEIRYLRSTRTAGQSSIPYLELKLAINETEAGSTGYDMITVARSYCTYSVIKVSISVEVFTLVFRILFDWRPSVPVT